MAPTAFANSSSERQGRTRYAISEALGAEGRQRRREERAGAGETARPQLPRAPGGREALERERAEVGGGEIGDVERDVGLRLGPSRLRTDRPATGIVRTHGVGDLDHDGLSLGVRPRA